MLNRFFSPSNNFLLCWIIFFCAIFVRFIYFIIIGVKYGSDSTHYTSAADLLLRSHFNFSALIEQGYAFFYWLYPLFLTPFQHNFVLVISAQIILQSIASVLIFQIASRLFNTPTGCIAGLGYAFLWEAFQWDVYVLTDSLFVFLLILTAFLALRALDKKNKFYWGLFLASFGATLFLRPTLFPFLASIALFLSWHFPRKYKLAFGIFGLSILGWCAYNIFWQVPGPQFGLAPYFHYFASLFEKGIIVHDRHSLIMDVRWTPGLSIENVFTFSKLFAARLAAFWLPIVPEFSFGHKIISLLTFIPLLSLSFFGILQALRNITDPLKQRFLFFMFSTILFFWIFQALTEVDYDWRYRLPVLPFLVIFASYGCTLVFEKLTNFLHNFFPLYGSSYLKK